jgi:hypothetical protein
VGAKGVPGLIGADQLRNNQPVQLNNHIALPDDAWRGIRTDSTEPGNIDAHLVLGDSTPSPSLSTETRWLDQECFLRSVPELLRVTHANQGLDSGSDK